MKACDLQERFGDRELHSMDDEANKIVVIGYEQAKSDFPSAMLSNSEHLCYFPFRLCHSIPKVNSRGRTFMPAVLQKSFASLQDQCLDFEHELVDNKTSSKDRIIGHVKAVKFDCQIPEQNSGSIFMPKEPLPVVGLGCLYKRAEGVSKILQESEKKPQSWRVSMECYHNWADAYLWYGRTELIPVKDAPDAMLDCIDLNSVKPYKGRELAVCIGGMDKTIAMLGAGLTTNPADSDAEILGFVSGISRELSSRKIFHMPLRSIDCKALEVASATTKMMKEMSSIAILGVTQKSGMDDHDHMVLNDGTVMPTNGHTHCMKTWTITPGNKASFSGVTDPSYDYIRGTDGERASFVHNHLFNIDLKKKAGATAGVTQSLTADYSASDLSSATVTIGEIEMNFSDMLKELAKELRIVGSSGGDKPAAETTTAMGRINELASKFEKVNAEEEIKTAIQKGVDERIAAGLLLTKEKYDAAVLEAKAEAEKKIATETKRLEVSQKRRDKCREAGIDLTFPLEGLTNAEGKSMTVGDRVDSFAGDDQGEKNFIYDFTMWKKIVDDAIAKEKEAAQQKVVQQTAPAKEAASANGGASKKPTLHLAGGGPSGEQNTSDPWKGFGAKPANVRKDNGGIHLLTR